MTRWPFPAADGAHSVQEERLYRSARAEFERGVSAEIAARVDAAESRAAAFERECARLAAESARKSHMLKMMAAEVRAQAALIAKLRERQGVDH